MTMFDRLPRRQINPEAGQYDEVEDGGFFGGLNRMPGLFNRFSGPTGGSEYFNFGGNYEPPEGY
jgi:hypothetical protein